MAETPKYTGPKDGDERDPSTLGEVMPRLFDNEGRLTVNEVAENQREQDVQEADIDHQRKMLEGKLAKLREDRANVIQWKQKYKQELSEKRQADFDAPGQEILNLTVELEALNQASEDK